MSKKNENIKTSDCQHCEHLEECLSNGEAIKEKFNGRDLIHKKYVGLCKMQIERQNMEKVDEWETSPQPIYNFIYNHRYVFGDCKCSVPLDEEIVIDTWRTKKINGLYHFHCTKCGLHGKVF